MSNKLFLEFNKKCEVFSLLRKVRTPSFTTIEHILTKTMFSICNISVDIQIEHIISEVLWFRYSIKVLICINYLICCEVYHIFNFYVKIYYFLCFSFLKVHFLLLVGLIFRLNFKFSYWVKMYCLVLGPTYLVNTNIFKKSERIFNIL